jgi:DNA (cytosine-5)-methyltransferase 1
LADSRGNLALEFARLADRVRPRWIVWENVAGVLSSDDGRAFGSILGALAELGYGFAYRVLDAQFFGVAQQRRRVFVVGRLGDWRAPAAVLLEPARVHGDPASSSEETAGFARGRRRRAGVAGTLLRKYGNNSVLDVAAGLYPLGLLDGWLRPRRLTPRECERLQGFPDDYTAIPGAKDGPRYAALGNSMAVPVMRWIGERIDYVDRVLALAA